MQLTRDLGRESRQPPHGETIHFYKPPRVVREPGGEIWKISIHGGPQERVIEDARSLAWRVTDAGIYFVRPAGGQEDALMFYRFSSGETETVAHKSELGGRVEFSLEFDVSRDGKMLIYRGPNGNDASKLRFGKASATSREFVRPASSGGGRSSRPRWA